jgi:hypothetical protein
METEYVPLNKFEIEPTLNDKFWQEKTIRSIKECNSINELREIAILLTTIATQRQGVIRGLVQDMFMFNNVEIKDEQLNNPELPKKE